jgi:hypothetical protein
MAAAAVLARQTWMKTSLRLAHTAAINAFSSPAAAEVPPDDGDDQWC